MKLSLGLVGLPNVGKSTLFNALLKKQVAQAENYPFCTIDPNIGIVEVPDDRLPALAQVVNTKVIIPAAIEFYDIAGLVKGASEGAGLGNKFLSHIREVAAIVHVVRSFGGETIHVMDSVDAVRDHEIISTELTIADLQTLEKQNDRKAPEIEDAKLSTPEWAALLSRLKDALNAGRPASSVELSDIERVFVKQMNLLTMKPVIYVVNIDEDQLKEMPSHPFAEAHNSIYLNAKLESELASFAPDEAKALMAEYGLHEPGLNRLIKLAYSTLGLQSFLTAGEKEVRAWTIPVGTDAQHAAGAIHTDFVKHFVKADIVSYADFIALGGWAGARDAGKITSAGKDYVMQEGDIVEFKING